MREITVQMIETLNWFKHRIETVESQTVHILWQYHVDTTLKGIRHVAYAKMFFHNASNCAIILLLLLNCIVLLSRDKTSILMRFDVWCKCSSLTVLNHRLIESYRASIVLISLGFDSNRDSIKKANHVQHRVVITSISYIALQDKRQ